MDFERKMKCVPFIGSFCSKDENDGNESPDGTRTNSTQHLENVWEQVCHANHFWQKYREDVWILSQFSMDAEISALLGSYAAEIWQSHTDVSG